MGDALPAKLGVHVLQIGEPESVLVAGARLAFGGKGNYRAPQFGTNCVCCNCDAGVHRYDYDPGDGEVTADKIEIPLCPPCQRHGLVSNTAVGIAVYLGMAGLALAILGWMYLRRRPDDIMLVWVMAAGLGVFGLSAAWSLRRWLKQRRIGRHGHHADFRISVSTGATLVSTSNALLAKELLELNGDAKQLRP